jgi:hypothetical protein
VGTGSCSVYRGVSWISSSRHKYGLSDHKSQTRRRALLAYCVCNDPWVYTRGVFYVSMKIHHRPASVFGMLSMLTPSSNLWHGNLPFMVSYLICGTAAGSVPPGKAPCCRGTTRMQSAVCETQQLEVALNGGSNQDWHTPVSSHPNISGSCWSSRSMKTERKASVLRSCHGIDGWSLEMA